MSRRAGGAAVNSALSKFAPCSWQTFTVKQRYFRVASVYSVNVRSFMPMSTVVRNLTVVNDEQMGI